MRRDQCASIAPVAFTHRRIVDSHQHFWRLDRRDHAWLTPALLPLWHDRLPGNLEPLLQRAGVRATIAVQAAETVEETRFLLAIAAQCGFVAGVVGWIDMAAPNAAATIAELSDDSAGRLKGLRPMMQDMADVNWMLDPALDASFRAMIDHDLAFDALIRPRHLPVLLRLCARYPDLRVMIDHAAKPEIASGNIANWATDMRRLAGETQASCKISGLVTEAAPDWSVANLEPYMATLLEWFGPNRLAWGSDWPMLDLASDYQAWFECSKALLAQLSEPESTAVFGGNATDFYRLDLAGP